MRSTFFVVATATVCLAPAAFSRSAADRSPQFEVATIKPFDTRLGGMNPGVTVYPGGQIRLHALTLKTLITVAFQTGIWQLSGGGDWMEKDVYDIETKAPPMQAGVFSLRHTRFGIEDERLRQMLQTLLTERFQLKLHRDTTTGSVYLLRKSGKTLQLRPTKYASDKPIQREPGHSGEIEYARGHWFVFDTSVPQLAKFASDYILHRPVLDQTGMTGSFDYREPNAEVPQEQDFEGSFPSFIQNLGLKLISAKGPVETWVIDHPERPSPN
jgi:uncharacterized protein (TIGR03435 family)